MTTVELDLIHRAVKMVIKNSTADEELKKDIESELYKLFVDFKSE